MSLRTKLLATAIGLPLAVLLASLGLVRQADQREYTTAEAMLELFERGQRSTWREFGRAVLKALDDGLLEEAWVFRWAREDTVESQDDVWTAEAYFSEDTGRLTEPDVDEEEDRNLFVRIQAEANSVAASLRGSGERTYVIRDRRLTIIAADETRGRRFAVVAQTRDRTGFVKHLYVILAAGVVLLGVIGWLAVSQLVIRPMERLARAADALAAGARPEPLRVRPGRRDEIGRTLDAFNRMAREILAYHGQLEERVAQGLERIQRTEQHLLIAQRLAATGKLAAGLAHEINNPLGGMRNAVRSLARGDLPPERQAVYLELIDEGLERVEQIVKRFLAFTPRDPKARSIDLVDVAERSLALAEHRLRQAGVVVRAQLPERGQAVVFGDPTELQQVVLNLLLNAADALAGQEGKRRVEILVARGEGEVVVRVRDNGPGIPPEDQDRCFDMFFTTKEVGEGSGMGLAVAHTIVTNHGGSITLSSPPGEGATFTIYLPSAGSGAGDPAPAQAEGGGRRDGDGQPGAPA
ncbi:MAG: sensor histidine kinase [Planctomycetota bacterium]